MIKAIFKIVFPPFLLKKVFLIYNTLKINTFDVIFFRTLKIKRQQFQIQHEKNPFLSLNVPVEHYPKEIKEKLSIWLDPDWTQDEYLIQFNQHGYIEPLTGWGITDHNRLIQPSLGFANAPYVLRPGFVSTYFRKRKIVKFNAVISLRDTGEENYFHFFNDIIPKLFFARDNGYDLQQFVIVVSERLYGKAYFRNLVDNSWLQNLRWYQQRQDEWIEFENAVFCKPFTHTKRYLKETFDILRRNQLSKTEKRIFLTRDTNSLRFIENLTDIELLLQIHNFEIVDAGKLTLTDQAEFFASCRYLIGIHGAGLVNMIFRKDKRLSILEISHPHPYIPFHYMMLAKLFDYQYDVLLGDRGRDHMRGGFRVDIVKFELALQKLLA